MSAAFGRLPRSVKALAREQFEEWWAHWPKKVAKQAAWKVWQKHTADGALPAVSRLIDLTVRQVDLRHLPADLQYVPNPDRWLRHCRWEDEVEDKRPKGPFSMDVAQHDVGHGRASNDPWGCECDKCKFFAKSLEDEYGDDARRKLRAIRGGA